MQADCSAKRTEEINPQGFEEEVFVRGDPSDDYYDDYYDSRGTKTFFIMLCINEYENFLNLHQKIKNVQFFLFQIKNNTQRVEKML